MKIKQVTFTESGEVRFHKFWKMNAIHDQTLDESRLFDGVLCDVEARLEQALMEGKLPCLEIFQPMYTQKDTYFTFIPSDYIVAYDYDKVQIEVAGNFKVSVQIEKTEHFYETLEEIRVKVNDMIRNELEALTGKYGKPKDEPFAECTVK